MIAPGHSITARSVQHNVTVTLRWALWLAVVTVGLASCSETDAPTTASCSSESDPSAREDCRLALALRLRDDRPGLKALVAGIPERTSRDILRIRLAVTDPVHLGWLCKDAEGPDIRTRCKYVVDRPHLRIPRSDQ